MTALADVSGLGPAMAAARAGFAPRLEATTRAVWRELGRAGRLRPDAVPPTLEIPPGFADVLAAAVALDAREPAPPPRGAADLLNYYLTLMPRLRVEQLATTAEPQHTLFHAPLDWAELPRFARAIDRLYAELGADAASALGPASAVEFRAQHQSLGHLYEHTHFGGFMPLLYGYPADLAACARALADGQPLPRVIDHLLTAPFVHELAHLGRGRRSLFPPYLDECIAGYLGVRVLPEFAFPAEGDDNALYATPWFAQVGQALARAVGWGPLLRAHAGALPWHDALPPGLELAVARLGWDDYRRDRAPHFLTGNFRPIPWMKLGFLAAAGREVAALGLAELEAVPWADIPLGPETALDAEILADALRAMCLDNRQVEHTYRVSRRTPAHIAIDLAACTVGAPAGAGGHDPVPPSYLFPPATAARLRAAGLTGFDLTLPDATDASLDAARAAILAGTATSAVRPLR